MRATEVESACSTLQAEMQKAAADAKAARENGQRAQAGARSGTNAERSQKAPVPAPAISGRPAMGAAPGRDKQSYDMAVPGKARQSAGVDKEAPQDSAAVPERKVLRPQSARDIPTNGSANATPEHNAAIRGSVQVNAPAESKAAVWQPQSAADGVANGTAHDCPERKAAAASTAVQNRKAPNGATYPTASSGYGDALLDAMLSDSAGTPQQSPPRAPTLHKGTQAAGRPSRSRPGSPGQPMAAPGMPPETGGQHQYLEVLIRNMQVPCFPSHDEVTCLWVQNSLLSDRSLLVLAFFPLSSRARVYVSSHCRGTMLRRCVRCGSRWPRWRLMSASCALSWHAWSTAPRLQKAGTSTNAPPAPSAQSSS